MDTTAPTVSAVQAPAAINRTVTLSVTADDNVGVTEVRFFVDDELLGSVASAPFSIDWDTSGESEGEHVLTAEAEDAAGNVGQSAETTVTVQNMQQFTVTLTGDEEVPPVDTQATAEATLDVNLVSGEVSGDLTVSGLTPTTAGYWCRSTRIRPTRRCSPCPRAQCWKTPASNGFSPARCMSTSTPTRSRTARFADRFCREASYSISRNWKAARRCRAWIPSLADARP
jgi:hypothetical protein